MNDSNAPQFTRDFLTDGYISYTFGPRDAEGYLVQLFAVDAASVRAIRHQSGAFYVLNRPSHNSPPALLVNGQDAWLLDYAVRTGGSVVPQQLWPSQGQGDRRRYVDQAQFSMPVFFINASGSLGVPVTNAAAGDMQLHGVNLPSQLADKTAMTIRISWPGYPLPEHQVQLRDQAPTRNPITLERFVKIVGSRVKQFLLDCERVPVQGPPSNWIVGHGNITSDEVMLIGLVQVSAFGWMPILQLMSRVVL
ncbi:hypothetical protein DFH94DRAFT_496118 [Russula ochroleuca]|jgi:hypothetical protein|uniref:Uncharacterized protein n=1 Tax=Russula ochroleuca TaxID=152965 RepID=A0A9P5MVN7_9AGAM|nr:hypothetical protein DFH94DRAFT_496118 [Russula ochroleuca]